MRASMCRSTVLVVALLACISCSVHAEGDKVLVDPTPVALPITITDIKPAVLPKPDCICPMIWAPVCIGGKTYGNRCSADCEGATGLACEGECGPDCKPVGTVDPVPVTPVTPVDPVVTPPRVVAPAEPCICTREYNPRCYNGKVYGNPCEARCAGATDATMAAADKDGQCSGSTTSSGSSNSSTSVTPPVTQPALPTCGCTREYRPVCYKGKTYSNPCLAKCEGATTATTTMGECRTKPVRPTCESQCSKQATPVCDRQGKQYSNACMARCAKVAPGQMRPCPAPKKNPPVVVAPPVRKPPTLQCIEVYRPVCWKGVTYGNMCHAVSAGATALQAVPGECSSKKVPPGHKKQNIAVMPKKNSA